MALHRHLKQSESMTLAFENGKAVVVRAYATREQGIAVEEEVVCCDGGCHVWTTGSHESRRLCMEMRTVGRWCSVRDGAVISGGGIGDCSCGRDRGRHADAAKRDRVYRRCFTSCVEGSAVEGSSVRARRTC